MIVAQVSDPTLRRAVFRAAWEEEDVFDGRLGQVALELGFPRFLVRDHVRSGFPSIPGGVPIVELDERLLGRWERERRAEELPLTRLEHLTNRLTAVMSPSPSEPTRVDRTLGDLSRAAGTRLPAPLRSFARRALEFPFHYRSLEPLAAACDTTPGALKARFRRRGLTSPSVYLRWLRLLAVSDLLSDRSVTVAAAARRLGFTSDGNLCRTMTNVTGMTPTEARSVVGWRRLVVSFAWSHLSVEALDGWATLDDLFSQRAA
jgi:AraC-like DNA-binding protein